MKTGPKTGADHCESIGLLIRAVYTHEDPPHLPLIFLSFCNIFPQFTLTNITTSKKDSGFIRACACI